MKKLTYLIGAGASCQSLPTVNQIPEKLSHLITFLKTKIPSDFLTGYYVQHKGNSQAPRDILQLIVDDLQWLNDVSKNHQSVDTYAKKLYLKRSSSDLNDLRKLKVTLSTFFTLEQLRNNPDDRYDLFMASLLDSNMDLPKNMRILSWNYDSQLELAYSDYYYGDKSLTSVRNRLGITSKFEKQRTVEGFRMYKLNGTAGYYDHISNIDFVSDWSVGIDQNVFRNILNSYAGIIDNENYPLALSFAWEKPGNAQTDIIPIIQKDIADTEIVVIIGYSFPFFNREIDRMIFDNLPLDRVYIQNPNPEAIIDRFSAIRGDLISSKIVAIRDKDQFYLPPEL